MRHALLALALTGVACTGNVPVTTQHNDRLRTGVNLRERRLKPDRVGGADGWHMRLRTWRPLDGGDGVQALYVPDVDLLGGGTPGRHDVIYVETLNNYVDAYDAEDTTNPGTTAGLLWHTQLPSTPDPQRPYPISSGGGAQGTPVIDVSTNTMYLVYGIDNGAYPWNGVGDSGYSVAFHIAALDVRSGAILRDSVVHAQAPSTVAPGYAAFEPQRQIQRAGLLLEADLGTRGPTSVYIAFASRWREETHNWHGWVMRYDAATFNLLGVFCTTPDRRAFSEGDGVWEGGGGLPQDDSGNVYFLTGNGPAGTNSWGNSIVRLSPTGGGGGAGFNVAAFSAAADDPTHATQWANDDIDLGAGGSVLVPGATALIGGGKTGVYYMMNTNGGLTKVQSFAAFTNQYDPTGRYRDWQSGPHLHGAPTYWRISDDSGYVYAWGEKDYLRRYTYSVNSGTLDTLHPVSASIEAENYVMPGGNISLSAQGRDDAVLWVTHPFSSGGEVIAFDALTLNVLWSDSISTPANFIPPTVSNGLVIVPTANGTLLIYDLVRAKVGPQPPRTRPIPPYLIPLGDPAPRVEAALAGLPPGEAARLRPPSDAKARVLFSAAVVGTSIVDDIGIHPAMGFRGRGETLASISVAAGGVTIRATDGSTVAAARVQSGPNGWQLLRVAPGGTSGNGLLAGVTYVQRLGRLITFWGPRPGLSPAQR